jgi:hypothetical protein
MARYLYIVSRDQPLVYGCLQVTQEGPAGRRNSAEVIFDRRQRGSDATPVGSGEWSGAERRRDGEVEAALLSQGYAVVRVSGAARPRAVEAFEEVEGEPLVLVQRRRGWRLAGAVCGVLLGIGLLAGGALVALTPFKPAGNPGSVAGLDALPRAGAGGPGSSALDRSSEATPPGSSASVTEGASRAAEPAPEPAPAVVTTVPEQAVDRPESRPESRQDERSQNPPTGAPESARPGLALPERAAAPRSKPVVPPGQVPARVAVPAPPRPPRGTVAAAGAASSRRAPSPAAKVAPEAPVRPSPGPRGGQAPQAPVPAGPEAAPSASLPSVPVGLPRVEISRERDPSGRGKAYAIRLSDVEGHPVGGAEVWMLGRRSNGTDLQMRLVPGSSAGLYRGSVPSGEGEEAPQLTVRVVLRTLRFEVPVNE